MATLAELRGIWGTTAGKDLENKTAAAVAIWAAAVESDIDATQLKKDFAIDAIKNPATVARDILAGMIADNPTASVAQITGASDASIQSTADRYCEFASLRTVI